MNALEVRHLCKSYRSDFWLRKLPAIEDLNFSITKGKVTGFLGANGAGKSTTIKCILGLLLKDSGEIVFFEKHKLGPAIRQRIGFLPERPFFYEYLTSVEFLDFYARLSGLTGKKVILQRIEELLELVGLSHAKNKKLREFSKGMLQRIGIAQAILHDPDLIIFDEPMSGLDPDGRYDVGQILQRLAEQDKTVFFSSHLLDDVQRISQDLVILKNGELIYQGDMLGLLNAGESDYRIDYRAGDSLQSEVVANHQDLQARIDALRSHSHEIFRVEAVKANLEQAYVQLNKNKEKTHESF